MGKRVELLQATRVPLLTQGTEQIVCQPERLQKRTDLRLAAVRSACAPCKKERVAEVDDATRRGGQPGAHASTRPARMAARIAVHMEVWETAGFMLHRLAKVEAPSLFKVLKLPTKGMEKHGC
jgi:hypothetical protein